MNRPLSVMALLAITPLTPDGADVTPPLTVEARVAARAYVVGEAVPVRVEVRGAAGAIRVEPPRVADADIRPIQGPTETTAGSYAVIARRSGPLVIPAFRARSGSSVGSSRPIRLMIADVPADGRPAWFLGGVGPFDVASEVEPASVRAGRTFEYRVRVVGPAAWGGARPPDLGGWPAKVPGLRVEPLAASDPGGDGPARTFRYRIRATRAGRWTLPPVPVAAFDPASRRYQTRYAPGRSIEVIPPAGFDPTAIEVPSETISGRRADSTSRPGWIAACVGLSLGVIPLAAWVLGRRRRVDDPSRFARTFAARLDPDWDAEHAARAITAGLADLLQRMGGKPSGELTPREAEAAVAALVDDGEFVARARRLVEACDRSRFGSDGWEGRRLVDEARVVMEGIAKAESGRGTEGGSRDRDASQ